MNDLKNSEKKDRDIWKFCPRCGYKLPKIDSIKFCTNCGLNLEDAKDTMELPAYTYQQVTPFQYKYKREKEKITDDQISEKSYKRLWSTNASIFLPLLAFIVMNFLAVLLGLLFVLFIDINLVIAFLESPFFFILSSLVEFVFIFFPIIFMTRYLKKPSLKNKFRLLGLTTEHFNKVDIVKEVLIGIAFGIMGLFSVRLTSMILEFLLELIPGVRIEYVSSEVDLLIGNATLLEVILFLITMFLVVAFSEEILFRGFQQKGLMFNLGPKKGILVGALIFTLIHLIGVFFSIIFSPITFLIEFILSFFPYFVISIILAYLFYWRNENLIAVIITHGLYNSLTIFMAYLLFNLENLIISYVLILLVVFGISLILYYVLNKFFKWQGGSLK